MRKIAVLTGSRADRSPLSSVIEKLGEHAFPVETNGLYGNEKHVLEELRRISPDLMLVLGDRTETLLGCALAVSIGIPIAHVHGGEDTFGSTDQYNRYAISALSYWHFVCRPEYKARLERIGEFHGRIFTCGAPGVDVLVQEDVPIDIEIEGPMALVCVHPEASGVPDMREVIAHFADYKTIIISGSNADNGGAEINSYWEAYYKYGGLHVHYRPSFSHAEWVTLMKKSDVLIGNSSGFVFEGMTLGKKVIMVGDRQKGRYDDAVEFFKAEKHPYGVPGEVSQKIADKLLSLEISSMPRKILYGGS